MRGLFPWQRQSCQDQPWATSRGRRGLWARPWLGEGFLGLCQVLWGPWLTCRWSSPAHGPRSSTAQTVPCPVAAKDPSPAPSLATVPHLACLHPCPISHSPAWPWPPSRVTCPDLLGWLLSKPDIACPAWLPTGAPTPAQSVAARDLGPLLPSSPDVFLCVRFSLRIFKLPQWTVSHGSRDSRGVHSVARALLRVWLRGVCERPL